MQFPLTVWRAFDISYLRIAPEKTSQTLHSLHPGDITDLENVDPGISWTIDKEWCIGYAKSKGRVIRERQVYRGDIFAYVTRRGESEMIILD